MAIRHFSQIKGTFFNEGPAKGVTGRVLVGKADGADHFCMRMFQVAPGGHTPLHSHPWEHEIFVHSGKGAVFLGGQWTDVEPGTAIFIPGTAEHQMKSTGGDVFTVVCLVPAGVPEL